MITDNNLILIEYMKANFAHQFRTPFSAINISLNSLQKVFPFLLEGYVKACSADLIDNKLNHDYLAMIEQSVKNSLNEIAFCDHYLNRLLLLLKDNSLGSGSSEKRDLVSLLEHVFSLTPGRQACSYEFVSDDTFGIDFNPRDIELCFQVFFEELMACKNEQQADVITIKIDQKNRELSFQTVKSKPKSHICDCIKQFMQGDFHQRYGLGFYLVNQLLRIQNGEISLTDSSKHVTFLIKF